MTNDLDDADDRGNTRDNALPNTAPTADLVPPFSTPEDEKKINDFKQASIEWHRGNSRDVPSRFPASDSHVPPVSTPVDQAWRERIESTSERKLREQFPGEYSSHKGMLRRAALDIRTVDPELQSLKGLLLALGQMPQPGMTVDCIHPDLAEYRPGLIRWATRETQDLNKTNTAKLVLGDFELPIVKWAEATDQNADTLRKKKSRDRWLDIEIIVGHRLEVIADGPIDGISAEGWPAGIDASSWNGPFEGWRAGKLGGHPAATKSVFCAWITGNIVMRCRGLSDDQRRAWAAAHDAALADLEGDRDQLALLSCLRANPECAKVVEPSDACDKRIPKWGKDFGAGLRSVHHTQIERTRLRLNLSDQDRVAAEQQVQLANFKRIWAERDRKAAERQERREAQASRQSSLNNSPPPAPLQASISLPVKSISLERTNEISDNPVTLQRVAILIDERDQSRDEDFMKELESWSDEDVHNYASGRRAREKLEAIGHEFRMTADEIINLALAAVRRPAKKKVSMAEMYLDAAGPNEDDPIN